MDVIVNEAVGQLLHGKAEQTSADGLHDILYEFRAVGFYAFPFLGGSYIHVRDEFATELVLINVGLYVGEYYAGRKFDKSNHFAWECFGTGMEGLISNPVKS